MDSRTRTRAYSRRLVAVRTPGLLGDATTTFAVPLVVFGATHSAGISALSYAAQWIPRVLLLPIVGVFVDRYALNRQLVGVDAARSGACVLAAVSDSLPVLVVVAGILMLLDSHATIATERAVLDTVLPGDMPSTQSLLVAAGQATRIAGPALAGLMIAGIGSRALMTVSAFIFLIGAIATRHLLGTITERTDPQTDNSSEVESILHGLVAGARSLIAKGGLRHLLAYAMLLNSVAGAIVAVTPAIVIGEFGADELAVGIVTGAGAAGSVVVAVALSKLLQGRRIDRLPVFFAPVLAVSAVGMAASAHLALFAMFILLWSSAATVFNVWLRARRLQLVQPHDVGRTLGFFTAAMLAAVPIGGLVIGVISLATSLRVALWVVVCAAVSLIAAALVSLLRRNAPLSL